MNNLEEENRILKNTLKICCKSLDNNVRIACAKTGMFCKELENDINPLVRRALVDNGYGVSKFIDDESWIVREGIALQGYDLNYLAYDEDWRVRRAVAKSDKFKKCDADTKDYLAFDKSPEVRAEVAKQGIRLNILVDDPSPEVRAEVASRGYELSKLAGDESAIVRGRVAEQGKHLNRLVNDLDPSVKLTARTYGHKHELVGKWVTKYNRKVCSVCKSVPEDGVLGIRCKVCYAKIENPNYNYSRKKN